MSKMVYVAQPFLPPLEEFLPYLEQIWKNKVLTNGGPFHQQLERELCEHLGVPQISLFTQCHNSLVTALQALGIKGEVITTPYSFVATGHALLWNGIKPVFVDIDPVSLNIDPAKIEAAITEKTTAIMPVHCYGNPCESEKIDAIARKHNLKVIYDAAHAFGVKDAKGSILNHGDLSVLSFHATKVFTTFEGGAIVSKDLQTKVYIDQLKNFGHDGEITVHTAGINGKMSEVGAAMGLLQLKYIHHAIENRRKIDQAYRDGLKNVKGVLCLKQTHQTAANYSYFPVLIKPDFPISRDELNERLKTIGVTPRRYFYPLISEFPMYQHFESSRSENLPVATKSTREVLCLPIYPDLDLAVVEKITKYIASI